MAISVPFFTVKDLEHFPEDGKRYEWRESAIDATVTIDLHEVFADIDSL